MSTNYCLFRCLFVFRLFIVIETKVKRCFYNSVLMNVSMCVSCACVCVCVRVCACLCVCGL
eukprot:m.141052 g.141052  ORF g.141052 m.141052 type:complete len:61 (-) comp13191_c0_seq3:1128-1310(-)